MNLLNTIVIFAYNVTKHDKAKPALRFIGVVKIISRVW